MIPLCFSTAVYFCTTSRSDVGRLHEPFSKAGMLGLMSWRVDAVVYRLTGTAGLEIITPSNVHRMITSTTLVPPFFLHVVCTHQIPLTLSPPTPSDVRQILALNCLTSAYMLSALYLRGVKQGDGQLTVLGLVISALFYCASRSHPLRRLSAVRPPARIFCAQACMSVLGQFAAHLAALLAVTRLCEEHVNPEDPSIMPDGPFRPNIFNSAVFLLSAVMQVRYPVHACIVRGFSRV